MVVANPNKSFQFAIDLNGIPQFEVQTVDFSEVEIDQDEHGAGNHSEKTAGRIKFGNIKMEKLRAASTGNAYAWRWIEQCQNAFTGGGSLPIDYKKNVTIRELDVDGRTTVATWLCEGFWPCKFSLNTKSRTESGNVIETVEFAVDRVRLLQ